MALQSDLIALAKVKSEMASLTEQKSEIEGRILIEMTKKSQKTASLTVDGASVKATVVAGQRVVIDEQRVKERLDAKMWRKVSRTVLDKDKLEAAVALGDVDAALVAECSDIKDTKPYVKISGDLKAISGIEPPKKARTVKARPR